MRNSGRNILMVDRSYMVDRRIVLEAKTLRRMGCNVLLACVEDPEGTYNQPEIDGMPIIRFPEYARREPPSESLPMTVWMERARQGIAPVKETVTLEAAEPFVEIPPEVIAPEPVVEPEVEVIALMAEPVLETEPVLELPAIAAPSRLPSMGRFRMRVGRVYAWSKDPREAIDRISSLPPRRRFQRSAAIIAVSVLGMVRGLASVPRIFMGGSAVSEPPVAGLVFEPYPEPPLTAVEEPMAEMVQEPTQELAQDPVPEVPVEPPPPPPPPQLPINVVSENLKTYFENNPLDTWEQQIAEFALSITDLNVVHMHDVPALRAGMFAAKQLGLPAIFDAHELYPYQPNIFGKRKATLFDIESRFIHHCARVVAVNRQQADIMRRDYGFDRFTFLTNATERPEGFDVRKRYDYIRAVVPIPQNHKIMLFMGGINTLRKIDQLLMGMAHARKDVHMVFLTWGGEIPFFRDLARKLGIEGRVHFLDPVPWSDIVYWCASADVGVMPYQALDYNTRISSPNKLYEFIAAGTPMIASSELVNVRAVIESHHFGVTYPLHGPEDYTTLIDAIFDEEQGGPERFRASLIQKGDPYLWENEANDFIAMYDELLQQEKPATLRKVGT